MAFKLGMKDERSKIMAVKAVAGSGVDSIAVDMKERKKTVAVKADPVCAAIKHRKLGHRAELLSVYPAKEEKEDKLTTPSRTSSSLLGVLSYTTDTAGSHNRC